MSEEKINSINIAGIKNLFNKNSYNIQRIISILTTLDFIEIHSDKKLMKSQKLFN